MPKKPIKLQEIGWIDNNHLRRAVNKLLVLNPTYLIQPSSVTGKHHKGESRKEHIQMALRIMKYICTELRICQIRRDKLFAAVILHDIGYIKSLKPGRVQGWKYFKETKWSSSSRQKNISHAVDGFDIIMGSDIPEQYKVDIANMVLKHMSHWYNINTPLPETEDEKFVAISDFLASRDDILFVGIDAEDWRK